MNKEKRLDNLLKKVKGNYITINVPSGQIKIKSEELLELLHELLQARRENRKPDHYLFDKNILEGEPADESGRFLYLIKALAKSGDDNNEAI